MNDSEMNPRDLAAPGEVTGQMRMADTGRSVRPSLFTSSLSCYPGYGQKRHFQTSAIL